MKRLFLFSLLTLLIACAKPDVKVPPPVERKGGAIFQDDKNTPLIVSKLFLTESSGKTIFRGKPVKDNVAPLVQITSPSNGSVVKDMVNVIVTGSDNVLLQSLSLQINGVVFGTVSGYNSYTFTFNSVPYKGTVVSLVAIARDKAGNSAYHAISVTVDADVVDTVITNTTYRIYAPPVLDQGSEGSCVGFSIGYTARSIDWHYKQNESYQTFSPEHVYNLTKFSSDCNSGTAMQTVLDFIQLNGILPYEDMPYSASNGCALEPTPDQKVKALDYRITSYNKLYAVDSVMMKTLLHQKKAIIVTVSVDNSFVNASGEFIWKVSLGYSFGHSFCIIGYDDVRHAWLIVNSWGTGWGDKGYAWIDYDFFPSRTGTYVYAIN